MDLDSIVCAVLGVWAFYRTDEKSLTIGEWTITPWRDERPKPDDPSDYVGMGWVGSDGRP